MLELGIRKFILSNVLYYLCIYLLQFYVTFVRNRYFSIPPPFTDPRMSTHNGICTYSM